MSQDEVLGRLLLAIAIVIVLSRLLAVVLGRLRQPPVLAEILAGIALGPTLLGAFPGNPTDVLFPHPVYDALVAVGGVGLVLFMFLVGLELDFDAVRTRACSVAAVSAGSLVLPFTLGLALATALYSSHSRVRGDDVGFIPFALFIALALSITAFPVLARILVDRGLQGTPIGHLATASAAIQDLAGWLLLGVALATMSAAGTTGLLRVSYGALALGVVLLGVVRPLLKRYLRSRANRPLGVETLALLMVLLAACAGATQLIGLHSLLGAFSLGLVVPRTQDPRIVSEPRRALTPVTLVVLLPIYFLGPGLNVNLRAIGGDDLTQLALIMACACCGKLLGASLPARATGLSWRDAGTLGVLLNTRGLMELIVLNVGLTAGVLDRDVFSIMVAMAVATTLMTGPLLHAFTRRESNRLEEPRAPVVGVAATR